jgi:hypothetical protein
MKTLRSLVLPGFTMTWLVLASAVHGADVSSAPYPASPMIQEIIWHWDTHRTAAIGSDLWPTTWGPDGHLYAAWGDGGGFGGSDTNGRVSLGFARIENGPGDFRGVNINGGLSPEHPASFPRKGKTAGILFIDGTLYANINLQDGRWPNVDHVIAWSKNLGATWAQAAWRFPKGAGHFQPARFLNFGQNYTGVPAPLERFVYVYGPKQPASGEPMELFLARVPKTQLLERAAYEFFSGCDADGKPQWSPAQMQPIFADPNGVSIGGIAYIPDLKRFLLTSFHTGPGQLGVFEGPSPWGPGAPWPITRTGAGWAPPAKA